MIETEFGTFLEAARHRKGLSLRAVEEATGISNAYLSQLEKGKIKQPSPTVLYALSELYEVPYRTLMELVGYPVPDLPEDQESTGTLAARIGPVTEEEEDALIEYLDFLRKRRSGGKRR